MSDDGLTTDQGLKLLQDTPLPAGHVWYARSMTEFMETLERKVFKTTPALLRWLHRQAASEGEPLEFALAMYHPSPAFRFYAGRLSFRIVIEKDDA